jgi:hypothetical protein
MHTVAGKYIERCTPISIVHAEVHHLLQRVTAMINSDRRWNVLRDRPLCTASQSRPVLRFRSV